MKIRGLFIFLFAAVLCYGGVVAENGQLNVKGSQLVNDKGEPIVLRGVSYGWHNWWPRFYNSGSVKWLKKDWKVTVLRAAMGVDVDSDSAYIRNPEFTLKRIEDVAKACIKNDIYVIIDWHTHRMLTDEAKTFFAMMAKKYGEYPHVIYEIYNEPVYDSWIDLKTYASEVIGAIRAEDPDNIILVGNPHWGQDIHIVADDPLQGFENIMYTLHFYAATHEKWLRERGNYALGKGIPVFVSECAAMEASGDGPIDEEKFQAWVEWMEKNKISWITWSISDKDETCSMLYPSAKSTGKWQEKDLKKSGLLMREMLRKYNR
jgi:endoglucanase